MLQISENDNEKQQKRNLGEKFEVRLSENPTTGFQWHFVSNGFPHCSLLSDTFEGTAGTYGQPGQHRWQFETTQTGDCAITLVYRRSQNETAARTFTLPISVAE